MLGTNPIRKQIQVQTLKATLENVQRKLIEQKIESNEEIQKIKELPTRKKKRVIILGEIMIKNVKG